MRYFADKIYPIIMLQRLLQAHRETNLNAAQVAVLKVWLITHCYFSRYSNISSVPDMPVQKLIFRNYPLISDSHLNSLV